MADRGKVSNVLPVRVLLPNVDRVAGVARTNNTKFTVGATRRVTAGAPISRGEGVRVHEFVSCLSHPTTDHASLARRSTGGVYSLTWMTVVA